MSADLISCIALATSIFAWGAGGVSASGPTGNRGVICSDGTGGCFVAAEDDFRAYVYYPLGFQTFAMHIASTGKPVAGWSPPVLVSASDNDRLPVAIALDLSGGAYVLLFGQTAATHEDALLAHFDVGGTLHSGWPDSGLVVARTAADEPPKAMCADGSGGVFVGWQQMLPPSISFPKLQRVMPNGSIAPGWPDSGIVVARQAVPMGVQTLVPDLEGGCYVVVPTANQGFVQHITATGAVASGWPAGGLPYSTVSANEVFFADAAVADGQGGVIVAWDDDRVAPNHDPFTPVGNIYAQRFAPDGSHPTGWPAEGLPVCVAPGAHWDAHLCADGTGGAVVTWSNRNSPRSIGVQRVLGSGEVAPGWPRDGRAVGDNSSSGTLPLAASDGQGGAFLAWLANDSQQPYGYVQHVLGDGTTAPGWPTTAALLALPGVVPYSGADNLALIQSGNAAIVVWAQGVNVDIGGVRAQRLAADGVVPTQLALRDAHATSTEVSLTWWGAGAAQSGLVVERSTDGPTWSLLGPANVSGSDAVTYVDHAVVAGTRYAYRLANSGAAVTSPEWVDVPISAVFALAGAHPNPSPAGRFDVEFSLAKRTRGTLELLDVAGRRLAWRDVSALEPGRHVARFAETSTLAPGLYWLRLSQGSHSATARVAIVN